MRGFKFLTKKYLTFYDIEFIDQAGEELRSGSIFFENGYGISVVSGKYSYGGEDGLWEIAVLDKDGSITYDTPITDDVIGWLSSVDVTNVMKEIQDL